MIHVKVRPQRTTLPVVENSNDEKSTVSHLCKELNLARLLYFLAHLEASQCFNKRKTQRQEGVTCIL